MPLSQDHVTAGVGAGSAASALPIVLSHFQGVDANTASAESVLILMAMTALYAAGSAILARRKPKAA